MSNVFVVMRIDFGSDGNSNVSITGVWSNKDRAEASAREILDVLKELPSYSNVSIKRVDQDYSTVRFDMEGRDTVSGITRILNKVAVVESKWCLSPLEELAVQA